MKSKKILSSFTGYLFGGPLGGLLGYFSDDITEKVKKHYSQEDNGVNLLLLGMAVVKASGKADEKKVDFIRYYFEVVYGIEKAEKVLAYIPKVLKENYDAAMIARDASREYQYGDKLKIVNYLFRIVSSGSFQDAAEWKMISILANNLDIRTEDYMTIKKRYKEIIADGPFAILGCKESDSMEHITRQYRKLVLQHHPDRLKDASENQLKQANLYFQKIMEAYLAIKRIKSA